MNEHENDFDSTENENPTRSRTCLQADDLEVGKYIAVHSIKGTDHPRAFFGQSAQIKAIELPYLVILPVGSDETATIDIRYMNVMAVSDEFVKAQTPPPPKEMPQGAEQILTMLAGRLGGMKRM
jgi:hypothetical protein